MLEDGICYINGQFVSANDARVSIFDRGFTSGEGVYDVTRSYAQKLFRLDQHVRRLFRSLRYCRLDCGMSMQEMTKISIDIFERNAKLLPHDEDCNLWQVVSRGVDRFAKGKPVPCTVAISCVPIGYHAFAREFVEGCIVITPSTRRIPPQSLEAKAKITNKMNHTQASFEARAVHPRAIPLMLDMNGNISETHNGNFFFVSDGRVCTPTDRNILAGITRLTVIELAGKMGLPVVEGDFTPYDVYCADEAFTVSTSPALLPVKSLNGALIGNSIPGPITLRLMTAWREMVGVDFVGQALSHVGDADKQRLIGEWEKISADT